MKQPVMSATNLTAGELEDLAIEALFYRVKAREACVLAAFFWAARDRDRARWYVKDGARFIGLSGEIDGTGAEGPRQ